MQRRPARAARLLVPPHVSPPMPTPGLRVLRREALKMAIAHTAGRILCTCIFAYALPPASATAGPPGPPVGR